MVGRRRSTPATTGSLNQQAKVLLALTLLLSLIGLFFVFEASTAQSFKLFGHQYHFLKQQFAGFCLGIVALFVALSVPSKLWEKTAAIWYGLGIFLLLLVFIPGLGLELNGARRWLVLGPLRLQPIEFFKFALVSFYASWLYRHQKLRTFLVFTLIPALLTISQPDLGSLLIVLWIAFGLYFIAGGKLKTVAWIGGIVILFVSLAIFSSPYRLKRVTTFLNPESDPLGASFHIRQITLALGNGGWFGQGLGNSLQKFSYIPEASSDSVFAIVAEEVGFIGSLMIIGLFLFFLYTMHSVASKLPKDSFAYLAGYGIFFWISGHIILNLAAVVALVPLTGIPLPFFSFGSSALVMILFIIGVFLRLHKENQV